MSPHKQREILFIDDAGGVTASYRLRYTYRRSVWYLTSWQCVTWRRDHWKRVRNFGIALYRRWAAAGVPMQMERGVHYSSAIHSKQKGSP